jgi:citrate lyase subunit beta/citryl-CoA lyase
MTSRRYLRSFLFVPAANAKLLESSMSRPCDAVILDLEDGTHPSLREEARAKLPDSIARVKSAGKTAAVRINGDLLTAVTDLRAAVRPGLDILVLPKVEHARDVQLIGTAVRALETEAGIAPGHVRFLLQIESAAALPRLHDIASADPRVMGMMLGSEDFSLDCGGLPTADALLTPSLMVLYAARAAGVQPIGFVGSIADLGSPEAFQGVVERARALGFRGAVVVHPKFLDVVNACYTPSDEQVAAARKVVEAFEAADAQGLGAIKLDGIMIDKPVYRRALELLADAS